MLCMDISRKLARIPSETTLDDAPFQSVHVYAALGGMGGHLTDGYVLGIIGIALGMAGSELTLNAYWLGLLGAASLLGLLFGSLISGIFVDRLGRLNLYRWSMVAIFALSVVQCFVHTTEVLLVVRLLIGLSLGADYVVGLSLISEILPKRHRGSVLGSMIVTWGLGYMLSFCIGYWLGESTGDNWRLVLATSSVPAFLTMLVRWQTPESPNWLFSHGYPEKAQQVVERYFSNPIRLEHYENDRQTTSFSSIFGKELRANTFVGSVFYACQVIPYFAIGTFIPVILKGVGVHSVYYTGLIYNSALVIGSLIGVFLVNRLSRREFLIGGFYFSAITLSLVIVMMEHSFVAMSIFFGLFSLGLSASCVLDTVYPPELFPNESIGAGVGFVVSMSRLGSGLGTFLFPIISEDYGVAFALKICVVTLMFGAIVCTRYAPETKFK
ncbi:Inner membrane metabolite transport protein YgcS [Vibrio stylophorae]|uniref:Inner membrane metabolite transport protein YgcS n=2 Tax=Vibrio stylophorae TaxID=659351 RepID=A0ABM8ZVU5_9VIBR|nr:Inner membrane metabolite transport protein YgcS [Vibrio stylophorae]